MQDEKSRNRKRDGRFVISNDAVSSQELVTC